MNKNEFLLPEYPKEGRGLQARNRACRGQGMKHRRPKPRNATSPRWCTDGAVRPWPALPVWSITSNLSKCGRSRRRQRSRPGSGEVLSDLRPFAKARSPKAAKSEWWHWKVSRWRRALALLNSNKSSRPATVELRAATSTAFAEACSCRRPALPALLQGGITR